MLQLVAATGAVPLHDVSIVGRCADTSIVPVLAGAGAGSTAPHCLTLAAGAGADMLVTPCFLCFAYLNELQGRLERGDPARRVPVLYLSQLLGLACGVAPGHLELERLAVPSRRALARFVI
jgi:heterodisulfide reductase subunit B